METRINRKGISFVEVMVTAVILVSGITGVYRAYLASLNHLEYLKTRFYMNFLLDQKIFTIQKEFMATGQISDFLLNNMEKVEVNNNSIDIEVFSKIQKVDNLNNLFHINLGIGWIDNDRRVNIFREAYLRR